MSEDIRSIVANAFGACLAEKSTPELAARLAHSAKATRAYAGSDDDALSETVTLSFAANPAGPAPAVVVRELAVAVAGEGYGYGGVAVAEEPAAYSEVPGRKEKIRRRRTQFEEQSAPVMSYVRSAMDPRTIEASWLAGVVRVPLDVWALAEIAADPSLAVIDVPRMIWPEIHRTVPVVRAPRFRSLYETSGIDVIVGIIDREVLTDADFFGDRVQHRKNFTTEPWGNPTDHGTAIAGVIGANAEGHVGVAQGATLYTYKVFRTKGPTEEFYGAKAIEAAVEDGCRVVNCSWGRTDPTDGTSPTAKACDAAWEVDVAVIKSAGNRGPGRGTVTAPADASGVIVVGATNIEGTKIAEYSARGPTANGLARPHLVAPGGEKGDPIMSCLASGQIGACDGTSFAAAHVTGAAALLFGVDDSLTAGECLTRLEAMCEPLEGYAREEQGAGLLRMVR